MAEGSPVKLDSSQLTRVDGYQNFLRTQGLIERDRSEEGPTGFVLGPREIEYLRSRIGTNCSREDELALVEYYTGMKGKHAEEFLGRVEFKRKLMLYLAGRIIENMVTEVDEPIDSIQILPPAEEFETGMHVGANEVKYMFDLGDGRNVRTSTWDSALAGEVTGLGEDKAFEWGLRAALKTNFMLGLVGGDILRQRGEENIQDIIVGDSLEVAVIKASPDMPAAAKALVRTSALQFTANRRQV